MGLDRRAALWESRALRQAPDLPLFAFAEAQDEGTEGAPAELPSMPLAEHVISDYQTVRLSLKAHPMHFLRQYSADSKFVTAEQLRSLRDGRPLSIAGVVLIRQRPGTSKGVVFITIEDETGVANLVVWPKLFEKQRKIVMGARLMAVRGVVQKDPDSEVIHVVAGRLEDHTGMLSHLSDDSLLPSTLEKADHAGSWGRPQNRHPRNAEIIPKSRDFH
jgi:error-prone DNA polymerase